ncbi:MAG: hypothetical protein AAFO89_09365 [Planctomycetota bacterium]
MTGGSGFDRFIVDFLDGDTDTIFDDRDDELDILDFADVITRDLSLNEPVTDFISVNQSPDGSTALFIDPDGSAGPPQQVGVLMIHNGLVTPLQDLVNAGLLFYEELRTAAAHPPCRTHSGL